MIDQMESNQKKKLPWIIWVMIPLLISGFVFLAIKLDSNSTKHNLLSDENQKGTPTAYPNQQADLEEGTKRFQLAVSLKSQDAERALNLFNRISADSAHFRDALKQAAHIYYLSGRFQKAETKLLELNKLVPNDPLVLLALAELYFKTSDHNQALKYAQLSAEKLPDRVETYLLIAEIQDELDHPEKMIPALKQAVELDPHNRQAHLNLLYAYHYAGQHELARREAQWCLEQGNKTVFVYQTLAKIEIDQGQFDKATEMIQKAIVLDSENLESRIIEADLLLYAKKGPEAYQRLKSIYAENQNDIRYIGALARVAARNGDVKTAKALHKKLAEYHRQQKE